MRLLHGSFLCGLVVVGCTPPEPPPNQSAEVQRLLADERYEWVTVETPNTRVHFPVGSFAQANRSGLRERAEESRNAVLQRLHESEYAKTVELFYVDSRQDMENLVGGPVTGFAYYRDDAVVLVFNERWRAFERHELTHVVTLGTWPPAAGPAVVEGLATYVDGECGGYENGRVTRTVFERGELLSLGTLAEDFRGQNDLVAYLQAASTIDYVVQRRGPEALRLLWDQGLRAAPAVTGFSGDEFEQQFADWLSVTYDPIAAPAWDAIRREGCGISARSEEDEQ